MLSNVWFSPTITITCVIGVAVEAAECACGWAEALPAPSTPAASAAAAVAATRGDGRCSLMYPPRPVLRPPGPAAPTGAWSRRRNRSVKDPRRTGEGALTRWSPKGDTPPGPELRGDAAVHDEHAAVGVGGVGGREERHRAGDVGGGADAAGGHAFLELAQGVRPGRDPVRHRRVDQARAHAADAHAVAAVVEREAASQVDHAGLGGAVGGAGVAAADAGRRGDVHDAARTGLDHRRQKRLAGEERALQVRVEDQVPVVGRQLGDAVLEEHAGDVHEQRRRTQPGRHLVAQALHVRLGADIAAMVGAVVHVRAGDGVPVGREPGGDGGADAAGRPGDDGDAAAGFGIHGGETLPPSAPGRRPSPEAALGLGSGHPRASSRTTPGHEAVGRASLGGRGMTQGARLRPANSNRAHLRSRVLIADEEPPLLRMVVDLIRAHDGFEVTATAVDADEAADRAAETMPDVALLDVRMPGGGVSAARAIRSRSPQTHVVAHSAYHDTTLVLAMLRAGASGYVVKGAPPSELIAALEGAARGTTTLSGEAISGMVAELSGTRRETQRTANERGRLRREIRGVIDRCAVTSALQPIFDLERLEPVGYEALARFPNHSTRQVPD